MRLNFAFIISILLLLVISYPNRPVNVPPNPEKIRTIAKDINDSCQKQQSVCWESKIKNQLLDVYKTPDILSALYDYDTHFSCHAFTHFIGRSLYRKTLSIPDSYSQINFTCHGGTYHGVIEAYLQDSNKNIDALSGQDIVDICKDSKRLTPKNPDQVFTECLHGFGHAFMFVADYDLPKSLAYCDKHNSVDLRERCYGGVFMENSTSSTNKDHVSKWIKSDDRYYPCSILDGHFLNQCYFYQANYWVMQTVHNYPEVFKNCATLSGTQRDFCAMGTGGSLAGFITNAGMDTVSRICGQAPEDLRPICILEAVSSVATRYGGDSQQVANYCRGVDSDLKPTCFAKLAIAAQKWNYKKEDLAKVCQEFPEYYKICTGDAKVALKY